MVQLTTKKSLTLAAAKGIGAATEAEARKREWTNCVSVEGGLPLIVGGQIIGAIGVSGMPSDKDGIVAQAGADFAATLT